MIKPPLKSSGVSAGLRVDISKTASLLLLLLTTLLVGASKPPSALENVVQSGKLIVLSSNGPTTFYEVAEGYTGFEYSLAKEFADYLGVELEMVDNNSQTAMIKALGSRQGHMAAAGMSVNSQSGSNIDFADPYMESTPQLVYRAGNRIIKRIEDLAGETIHLTDNTGHAQLLSVLAINHPDINWIIHEDLDSLEVLEKVHNGDFDYTIVDSHVFLMNQGLYSQARIALDLSSSRPVAWAFREQADKSLLQAANSFMAGARDDGTLATIHQRYFGHLESLHSNGTKMFAQRIESRLPRYLDAMKTAAEHNNLDWHLIAAMSYQESFWNPSATSPTGVRGLMMLTRNTAKEVGVNDRTDPIQSISGGAAYLAHLRDRLSSSIAEPDRSWMALAAYNVGMGHLNDARILTERMGGNPDQWHDVMQHLPLLQQKKYYKTLKHGYARGHEAAAYVQRIRHYYTVLSWYTRIKNRKLALHGSTPDKLDAVWMNHSIL